MDQELHKKYLSDLQNGESGVITKVRGHGSFRKRINEMGFVTGTTVTPIKKAPLQDPVEYELMGYRVLLRGTEAQQIEIVSEEEAKLMAETIFEGTLVSDILKRSVREKTHTINVALVGNPNCGKTTLFNYATGKRERVGNYSGVTVDLKTAYVEKDDYTINITDLPGTYSISEYSPEELYVRTHLTDDKPDVVINVIDASNLERNLYLTTQLIDMNIKVIIALNMFDELEKKGDDFDYITLGKMLGIPIIPTIGSKGRGLDELLWKVIDVYEDKDPILRHIHVNYGSIINESVNKLKTEIKKHQELVDNYYPRFACIKLLEGDKTFIKQFSTLPFSSDIIEMSKVEIIRLQKEFNERTETIIANAKYGFIKGALKETYKESSIKKDKKKWGIDDFLTNRWLGFPLFMIFMWAMFQATFSIGSYPQHWIDLGVQFIAHTIENIMPIGSLRDLLVNGIIGGIGGVIVFLPNILILFFCISLMEDTGYMARAAFIMDRLMHRIGLHGKSFIPLLMGFGCNVPAIMSTRTLENKKDRLLTMLIIPFMSCSARLPVYILLISAFFPYHQGLVLLSVYLIGVVLAIIMALVFKNIFFAKKDVPFVMELPPYRIPTLRNTSIHMWDKSVQYITKMGTTILVASILIWALGYFPRNVNFSKNYNTAIVTIQKNNTLPDSVKLKEIKTIESNKEAERLEKSYIGRMGKAIEPAIQPLGFDWKIGVSILTGLASKEIVLGTMGVLYQTDFSVNKSSANLHTKLQEQTYTSGPKIGKKVFSPLVAFSLMVFILIYFPCVAVIAAIKRESDWKWSVFTMVYTTVIAWIVAFGIFQIGSYFL
jgi:ferrous iron transport protein B